MRRHDVMRLEAVALHLTAHNIQCTHCTAVECRGVRTSSPSPYKMATNIDLVMETGNNHQNLSFN